MATVEAYRSMPRRLPGIRNLPPESTANTAITTMTVMNTPPTRSSAPPTSCMRLVDTAGGSGAAAVLVIDLSGGRVDV